MKLLPILLLLTAFSATAADSTWQRVKRLTLKTGTIFEGMRTSKFEKIVPHGYPPGKPNYVTSQQSENIEGRPYALPDQRFFCRVGDTEFQVLITSNHYGYHGEVSGIWLKTSAKPKQ
jgi:hypothetical protein